jgi:itaconate CoA-transferase
MLISYLNAGVLYPRLPDRHHAIAPYGVFVCSDGSRLLIAIEHDAEWKRFAAAILGRPALGDDPRFASNLDRLSNRELVDALVAEAIGALTREEAERAIADLGLAYASLNDMKEVSVHPVVTERGMLRQVESNGGDTARTLVGLGERLFDVEHHGRARPPALGEHTDAVLAELGISRATVPAGGARGDGAEP